MADPMTRAEMIRNAHSAAGVYPDRDEYPTDPYEVNRQLDYVVQEMSRWSDTQYLTCTMTLTAGLATYCLPDLKNLERGACQVLDSAGILHTLGVTNVTMAGRNRPGYLAEPAPPAVTTDRVPTDLVLQGDRYFTLYPTPNYTKAAGIILRGFGVVNGSAWAQATDICPLPPRNHQTIVYGLAERVAKMVKDYATAADMRKQFLSGKMDYEKELATFTNDLRYGTGVPRSFVGASGPLNMGNYFG